MANVEEYTLARVGKSSLETKKSRFYGLAYPASSRDECDSLLVELRKDFADATHIVYAIRLGFDGSYEYFTDSGEPSGTAGAPILRVMKGQNISNAMVAVIRYFGGTKLGTGGLARAYGETARTAVDNAGKIPLVEMVQIEAKIPYGAISQWAILIDSIGGVIVSQNFTDNIAVAAKIPKEKIDEVESFVEEVTKGSEKLKF